MIDFLLAKQNMPFTVSLAVMLGMAVLEGAGALIGAGIFSFLDSLLPDLDLDAEIDGAEIESPAPFSRFLSWLRIGEVPAVMLLVIFLTAFGLIGLAIQSLVQNTVGSLMPAWLAAIPAFLIALPIVRGFAGILGKYMLRDETESVSEKTFIGRIAVVTLGKARVGSPAQAKLRDQHGQTHYVMVEPDQPGEEFPAGTDVLLVRQVGAVFKSIRNTSSVLVDQ